MDKFTYLHNELELLKQDNLLRRCVCIDSAQGPTVQMADGTEKSLFCSNNYLNLANDGRIRRAVLEAIEQYGFGATAARLICGTMTPHQNLAA